MATGRTVCKYTKFQIEDATADPGTMRDIPVTSFGNIGLTYDEVDLTAQQDAIKSVLNGQGSFSCTITGPFDTSAAVAASASGAAAALSGSHTVLEPLNGGNLPKSFGIYYGVQGYWSSDNTDPVFGGINSVIVSDYTVSADGGPVTYSCKLTVAANRTNDPDWGANSITASS